MLNVIQTSGIVCIYKKDIDLGKIKLDGSINTYIMYIADDENSSIRSLNTTLDFSKNIDIDNIKQDMILDSKFTLKSIECRVLNGRKVSIKAIIEIELKVLSNEEIEFVKNIEELKDIQILDKELVLNSILGSGITKVYAKDTLLIDSVDNLEEIMKVDLSIINQETKVSYNKVLVKADASIKIIYLTEDNRICSCKQLIPLMGFIDMPDVSDENLCDVSFELENLIVKPNSIEEHSIYVEAEIQINCNVSESRKLNVIQDLYSPSTDLNYKEKQIQVVSQMQIIKDIYSIREKQFITEIGNHKIYDVDIRPNIVNRTLLQGRIIFEGEIELNFLYEYENNRIDTKNIILPFNFNMECEGTNPSSNIETNVEVVTQDFTVMPGGGGIDIKIDLQFIVKQSNNEQLQVIEEINTDESREKERCSLSIYFVKQGDTLWSIAKKFHSTIDIIAKVNDIEDKNKINVGQQLFIPNYCLV